MSKTGKWVHNSSDSDFNLNNYFDTKEDAIKDGHEEYQHNRGCDYYGHFYVGEIGESFKNHIYIIADWILDTIAESIYERVGEVSEDYLRNVTQEQKTELEEMLAKTVGKWMDKHSLRPNFYSIENVEVIKIVRVKDE